MHEGVFLWASFVNNASINFLTIQTGCTYTPIFGEALGFWNPALVLSHSDEPLKPSWLVLRFKLILML